MPTTLSQFREVIINELTLADPQPVSIEKLYDAAIKKIKFDGHDLASTILRNNSTNDPNWKRNLRNALQGLKGRGELVNSTAGYWRLPSSNTESHLDPEKAWQLIKDAAQKAFNANESWESVKQRHSYKIQDIDDNKILIRRDSTNTIEQLYKSDVMRGIKSLNAAGGVLGRRAMIYVVAKEVAIVHFHPDLTWDDDLETLRVRSVSQVQLEKLITTFEEAKDDDVNKYQNYARRIRKGQSKLRKNLLAAYNNMCSISKTGPENVLQAAHIDAHSETGSNVSTNALLLRSDLHDLFDDGLLLIEPKTLIVRVHPKLTETYYFKYDGVKLADRTDNLTPDIQRLERKWMSNYWG